MPSPATGQHGVLVAFLACATTLPGSGERRGDAFEHDLMVAAIEPALAARGIAMRVIDWEADLDAFEGVDLALLGTSWNYQDRAGAFTDRLYALSAGGIAVCNPPDMVRWNIRKTYLRELESAGVATIPTLWRESLAGHEVEQALDLLGADRAVVKRQIGAGAEGQVMIERANLPPPGWDFGAPAMIQPFLPAIASEGELSFVFIDGDLSHALVKRPQTGDYRVQSLYGGREEVHHPSPADRAAAQAVIDALPFDTPLYARIDMVRMDQGGLALMEAELIEPYLYPIQGPQLGARLASALARRLGGLEHEPERSDTAG
ncbi:MAG: hypothetical protein V2J14_03460 [Erythrobacter sp.]|jgi:hypothetical protein|nr:hypothetical protein [Erythrobacter sp.]